MQNETTVISANSGKTAKQWLHSNVYLLPIKNSINNHGRYEKQESLEEIVETIIPKSFLNCFA